MRESRSLSKYISPFEAEANADIEGGKRSSQGITKVVCCTEDLCNAAPAYNLAVWLAVSICSAFLFEALGGRIVY